MSRTKFWPQRLDKQLALLASVILAGTILIFTLLSMEIEARRISDSIRQQAVVLTKNIAATGGGYLFSTYYKPLEELLLQSASYPGVDDLLVCDPDGNVIRQVRTKDGQKTYLLDSPGNVEPPAQPRLKVTETDKNIEVWYPIVSGILQGWVRIQYGLETLQQIQEQNVKDNIIVGMLGILFSVTLMLLFMHRPMRYISDAAHYAKQLDSSNREKFNVSERSVELRELGDALNIISRRLQEKDVAIKKTLKDLKDQKFALDQHSIVSIADTGGNIFYANQKFCELSGYQRSELMGKNYRFLNSGTHSRSFFNILWDTLRNGQVWRGEVCNQDKNGNYFWVDTTIVPFMDETGEPYQYLSIQTNITEIMNAEQVVRESRERLRRSQEAAQVGSWEWDIRENGFYWSEQVFRLYGMEPHDNSIAFDACLELVYPDDRGFVERSIELCMTHDSNYDVEYRVIRPDRKVCWLHASGDIVRDAANVPVRMLGIIQDVTDRKEAELGLIEYRDKLQDMVEQKTRDLVVARDDALSAERSMSSFLANMSHELRTPLHGILSYAKFGMHKIDSVPHDKLIHYFSEVHDSGAMLLNLVNNLLDLSKLRAGKMSYHYEMAHIDDAVQTVIRELSLLAEERQLNFTIRSYGEALPVRMDRDRIAQVVRNLLSNAIKFSEPCSDIEIGIHYKNKQFLEVRVEDSGLGIPDSELEHIFDAFSQSSKTRNKAGGTGLGLPICKEIIENGHDGWIIAENRESTGASFTFKLPVDFTLYIDR